MNRGGWLILAVLFSSPSLMGCLFGEGGGHWGSDRWDGSGGWGGGGFDGGGWGGFDEGWGGNFDLGTVQDPPPAFGQTFTQPDAPPPVSGGTLALLHDGTAVASDPDRDRIYVVDVAREKVKYEVKLAPHDEPGRVIEDGAGRVHVALRGAGALLDLDPQTGEILARRPVCPAPRGLAFEPTADVIHVACAGGELVTLPAAGGEAVRTLQLEPDLRDIIIDSDRLLVSRFRSAELLVVDRDGRVRERIVPGTFHSADVRNDAPFTPSVAWRMVPHPGGGVAMLHQRGQASQVDPILGGWESAGPCGSGIVHSTVARLQPGLSSAVGPLLPSAVVAVDVATDPTGAEYVVVAAGNSYNKGVRQLFTGSFAAKDACVPQSGLFAGQPVDQPTGQPIAVAVGHDGEVVVQLREPALLQVLSGHRRSIALSGENRQDTGHAVFHANSGGSIACAGCHPEGGEDGRTWRFTGIGARRTQSLRGGILGSEPFHWTGDMKGLMQLVDAVFVDRMGGPPLFPAQVNALASWIDTIPELPKAPPADPQAVSRGESLFNDRNGAGCLVCHFGPKLQSNDSVDVGSGGKFQVPSLRGLASRAPFMHDGCANTLADRFGQCGGGDKHGLTSQLTDDQRADLLAYLESL